jgi:transposase
MAKKANKGPAPLQLELVRPCCAAVDVGGMLMVASYSDREGNQFLLESAAFTADLTNMARTFASAGVTDVAMEATGSYWMPLFQVLEQHGMKVTLVNPKHFKNVDAQKTDVRDSQWLHQLHAHGLLRASHVAPETYRELRGYLHERDLLQKQKSDTLNRIQRLLTEMNIKVQHLITDIEGVAGMKLLRAIAAGVCNPPQLLSLIDLHRLKADPADLHKSLEGNYRPQFIKVLNRQLAAYDFFREEMRCYERLIGEVLEKMLPGDGQGNKPEVGPKTTAARKNQYSINVKDHMAHIAGVDLTAVEGLDEINVMEIVSVTGVEMGKWKTADHFTSWLNLSPRQKISGGKLIGYDRRVTSNKATQAFRMAAQSLWHSKGALGKLYRRLAAQKGAKKAIKAVARKLAVVFYSMLKNKTEFDKEKLKVDEQRQHATKVANIKREAAKYGYVLQSVNA